MNFKSVQNSMSIAAITASLMLGCGASDGGRATDTGHASHDHQQGEGHDHGAAGHSHIGPHGGHLIELGANEAFHAELVTEQNAHRVTIYVLDGKAKERVPIGQSELIVNMVGRGNPQQFKLPAIVGEGESGGMASCFQLESTELCTALDEEDSRGRMAVTIDGKQYVGEIERHDHDSEGQAAKHDHKYQ